MLQIHVFHPRSQKEKTIRLSKTHSFFLLVGVFFFLSLLGFTSWGLLHYRSQANQQAKALFQSLGSDLKRAELASKMVQLERSLERIQNFTDRLESPARKKSFHSAPFLPGMGGDEEFLGTLKKLDRLREEEKKESLHQDPSLESPEIFYRSLEERLNALNSASSRLETRVYAVYEGSQDRFALFTLTPSLWPVEGLLTSDFGIRSSPFTGMPKMHEGIDIAAIDGTPIFAPADGVVLFAGPKGGYGNAVILEHGSGISTLYGHTSDFFVREGEKVKRGQIIAAVGSTGASTGPHLHYEVHVNGVPTDPMNFLVQ